MAPIKRLSPEEEAYLESQGLGVIDIAKGLDADAARYAKDPQHGPLSGEPEFDTYELMVMNAPSPLDFQPCDDPCPDPDCACHYKPKNEDT